MIANGFINGHQSLIGELSKHQSGERFSDGINGETRLQIHWRLVGTIECFVQHNYSMPRHQDRERLAAVVRPFATDGAKASCGFIADTRFLRRPGS